MKQKFTTIPMLALCSALLIQPALAENSVETAEPMEIDRTYAYTYFNHKDDEDGNWYSDYHHYYSFTPKTTDEYTVEVKGNWINEDTSIEVKSQSGMFVDQGYYNPYLNRVTSTAKLSAGTKYFFEVWAGDESSTPQVLSTTVTKHVHEFETKDYEKCEITDYYDGYIDSNYGGYTSWCRVCDHEEEVTFPSPNTLTLSASKLTYNGKVQKPKIKITSEDGTAFTSYQVKYPRSKSPGKYKLTVTFTGDYTGSVTVPYSIVPAKPGTPKLKALKGGFEASWKKAGGADGYQVEWSIDKSFYWIDGQKNTKKPTFALKKEYVKNTVVYVHVRAYKTVGGKKICGGWSKGIKVKVK